MPDEQECAMQLEKIATVVPVDDIPAAVAQWTTLLGREPTFVDGERWAQFDVAGARIALAGTDRADDDTALMLKVADLNEARAAVTGAGLTMGPVQTGRHELRALVTGGPVPVIYYAPRP